MTTIILQTIVVLAAVIIIVRTEPALNQMSHCTPFIVRVAFHLLAMGAAAEIVCVMVGDVPAWPTAIVTTGVATLLICERRLRVLCPPPRGKLP